MPLDLPPTLPPEQADPIAIRRAATTDPIRLNQDGFEVLFFSRGLIRTLDAQYAAEDADSVSDLIRKLSRLAYLKGHLSAQMLYSRVGNTVYAMLVPVDVQDVTVEQPLGKYFDGLKTGQPLQATAIERRRALASLHADRAGLHAALQWQVDQRVKPARLSLTTESQKKRKRRLSGWLEFGNPGNRFVGRHFLDGFGQWTSRAGDALGLFGRVGITGLNRPEEADNYVETSLDWSRVTTAGVFGAAVRHFDFDAQIAGFPIEADLQQATASWTTPFYASLSQRWNVRAALEYTDKQTHLSSGNTLVQREQYLSSDVGLSWTWAWRGEANLLGAGLDAGWKKGLTGQGNALTAADLGYSLGRLALHIDNDWDSGHRMRLSTKLQFSDHAVPEQQQRVLGGNGDLTASLPGLASGDRGLGARLSWSPPAQRLLATRWSAQLFAEHGSTRFQSDVAGRSTRRKSQSDVGVELLAEPARWIDLGLSFAQPIHDEGLSDAVLDAADANVYFRIRLEI